MTRIDFHVNVPDPLLYACRLIRKVYRSGLKVICFCSHSQTLQNLDKLLWTFSEEDFLPHVCTGHIGLAKTPIVLTDKAEDIAHHDLLINLDEQWPPFFARFDRLVEIVSCDEHNKAQARLRYQFYKERGYPLNLFDQTKK